MRARGAVKARCGRVPVPGTARASEARTLLLLLLWRRCSRRSSSASSGRRWREQQPQPGAASGAARLTMCCSGGRPGACGPAGAGKRYQAQHKRHTGPLRGEEGPQNSQWCVACVGNAGLAAHVAVPAHAVAVERPARHVRPLPRLWQVEALVDGPSRVDNGCRRMAARAHEHVRWSWARGAHRQGRTRCAAQARTAQAAQPLLVQQCVWRTCPFGGRSTGSRSRSSISRSRSTRAAPPAHPTPAQHTPVHARKKTRTHAKKHARAHPRPAPAV